MWSHLFLWLLKMKFQGLKRAATVITTDFHIQLGGDIKITPIL